MAKDLKLTFFHAPNTRSGGTRALLEELGVDYDLHVLDLKAGVHREADYLAVNPMGKVPAIRHGEAVVSEQAAIMIYLADQFPGPALAPAIGDPLRGPYLRWMVFYGSCFEPAVIDRAQKHAPAKRATSPYAPAKRATSPYGTWQDTMDALEAQLQEGPWLLGQHFTAADVLWGTALKWMVGFGLVPDTAAIRAYVDRVQARPAIRRAARMDAELAVAQQAD